MSGSSKHHIEVTSVSLVELKAEISRRQIEIKRKAQKLDNGCTVIRNQQVPGEGGKKSLWSRKMPSTNNKASELTIQLENSEDQANLDRVRRSLEAKAKLYEALKAAAMDGNPSYSQQNLCKMSDNSCKDDDILVDFEQKAYEELQRSPTLENNEGKEAVSDEENSDLENNGRSYQAECSGDEWTEYVDSTGKKRMCMNKEVNDRLSTEPPVKVVDGPLTYAHLREGEIRDHGVGFYAFSEDSEKREAEMARIRELHRATEEGRARAQAIRTKRDIRMGQRLARLRARKGLPDVATAAAQCLAAEPVAPSAPPTPLPVTADAQSDIRLSSDDLDVASMLRRLRDEAEQQRAKQTKQQTTVNAEKRTLPPPARSNLADWSTNQTSGGHSATSGLNKRDWDRGKSMISAQSYIQAEREKRITDFAPPSNY